MIVLTCSGTHEKLSVTKLEEMKEYLYVQLSNKLMYNRLYIDNLAADLKQQLNHKITAYDHQIQRLKLVLEENNPLKILESGYAVLSAEEGQVISSVHQLQQDGRYQITLKDGFAQCLIEKIGSDSHGEG